MRKIFTFILCLVLSMAWGPTFSAEEKGPGGSKSPGPETSEIVLSGKLFCSLKRQVIAPFRGTITSLRAHSGQQVEEGDVLARYRLAPEAALELRRRVLPFRIKGLEMQLAEVEKNLATLKDKQRELKELVQNNLASTGSLTQINREVALLTKNRKLIQERLPLERSLARQERMLIKARLGTPISSGSVPKEGILATPIGGHVIWVHPELREGSETIAKRAVFMVGVMDPMLIRARIHEIEAVQCKVGDMADFSTESIAGRKFEAKVSRLSWASMTPQLEKPSYYEVEFQVANPDFILREGLRGQVVFRKP